MFIEPLTPREMEILQFLAQGMTDPEIAARLIVSTRTVRSHNSRMYSKMGVANRTQAVLVGQRRGWVDVGEAETQCQCETSRQGG